MKLSWMIVISVGLMLSAIALGFGYREWEPNMKEVATWKVYRDGLIQEAKKKDQAIKRVRDAELMAQAKVAEWNTIAAARTLPPSLEKGGIDLSIHGWKLLTVMPTFRNNLQRMLNTQMKQGGVRVVQGPTIPTPPGDPNQILSGYFNYPVLPPVLIFDLGNVTVEGTYKQITDNMKAWSRMPHFLAVADGLRLQGTSPRLTGTYAVSIVGFVQTTRPIFPELPEGGRVLAAAPQTGGGGAVVSEAVGTPPAGAGGAGANVPGRRPAGGNQAAAPGAGQAGANRQGQAGNRPGAAQPAGTNRPAGGAAANRPAGAGGAAANRPAGGANRPAGQGAGAARPGGGAGSQAGGR